MPLIDQLKEIIRCVSDKKCVEKTKLGYTAKCHSLFKCLRIATHYRKGLVPTWDYDKKGLRIWRKPTESDIYFLKLQLGEGWVKKFLLTRKGVKRHD